MPTVEIDEVGLTIISHSNRNRRFKIKLFPGDDKKHQKILFKLLKQAHEEYGMI